MTQKRLDADVVVIGGGLGGTSAALAAAKAGMRVIMTEETDWLGGQLTSQAVPQMNTDGSNSLVAQQHIVSSVIVYASITVRTIR